MITIFQIGHQLHFCIRTRFLFEFLLSVNQLQTFLFCFSHYHYEDSRKFYSELFVSYCTFSWFCFYPSVMEYTYAWVCGSLENTSSPYL